MAELQFLSDQTLFSRQHLPHSELHAERDSVNQRILISGWACRHRLLSNGRRQIINFVVPGDIIGPLRLGGPPAACATIALTHVETADASRLLKIISQAGHLYPGLAQAFQAMTMLEELFLRDQIVRLGRQSAYERMIHLFLELQFRLTIAGLAETTSFSMPLTRDVLADSLGLSVVHANRTLQQIRREALVDLRSGRIMILKPDLMREVADWTSPLAHSPYHIPSSPFEA